MPPHSLSAFPVAGVWGCEMKTFRMVAAIAAAFALIVVRSPVATHATVEHIGGVHAPKGPPPVDARRAAGGKRAIADAEPTYLYVAGRQYATARGASVTLQQEQPTLGTIDDHSLAELAVQSADGQQIVEVGWTVAPDVNGDVIPHLFVFHWVDRIPTCYNGCGFVPVASTVRAGDPVKIGVTATYKIELVKNKWWVSYNKEKIGYFPTSLWQGRYKQAGLVQVFGEVAATATPSCTDMGNGIFGSTKASAKIAKFGLIGSSSNPSLTVFATTPTMYNQGGVKAASFRYGGPGSC